MAVEARSLVGMVVVVSGCTYCCGGRGRYGGGGCGVGGGYSDSGIGIKFVAVMTKTKILKIFNKSSFFS